MADGFVARVEPNDLVQMLDRIGPSVAVQCRLIGQDAAATIVSRAQANVAKVTGETASRIHWEPTYDMRGVVVLAYRKATSAERDAEKRKRPGARFAQRHAQHHVDLYLEHGTKFMRKRPFFFRAGEAVASHYYAEVATRVQRVLDDLGR